MPRDTAFTFASMLAFAGLLLGGCAARSGRVGPGGLVPAATRVDLLVPIRNARLLPGRILVGGQPRDGQYRALRREGYRTVLNLRRPGERTADPGEAEKVKALGMTYVSLPIAGARGLTLRNTRALAAALGRLPRPILVHCKSGNRVGALFALMAYHLEHKSPAQALAIGRRSGLTKLEPRVRKLLGQGSF